MKYPRASGDFVVRISERTNDKDWLAFVKHYLRLEGGLVSGVQTGKIPGLGLQLIRGKT